MRFSRIPALIALAAFAAGAFVWTGCGVDRASQHQRDDRTEASRAVERASVRKFHGDAEAKKAAAAVLGISPEHVRLVMARWHVDKYWGNHIAGDGKVPYESRDLGENLLTTAGCTRLLNLLIGTGSTQAWDATHTRIGVSDTTGTANIADTDLFDAVGGSSHRQWKLVDQTTTVSSNVATFHATFATGEGNFHWQDFAIDQGTASGTALGSIAPMLNHKASDLGTKTSAASWALSVTLTIS